MKTVKNPYSYKRIKERDLPFLKASRVLVDDLSIHKILNNKGFPRRGDRLVKTESLPEGELGYIDLESLIAVCLLEIGKLQHRVKELEDAKEP